MSRRLPAMDFASLPGPSFIAELRVMATRLVDVVLDPSRMLTGYLDTQQRQLFQDARVWQFERVADRTHLTSRAASKTELLLNRKANPKMDPPEGQLRKVFDMEPGSVRDERILRPIRDVFHGEHPHLWPPVLLSLAGEWAWRHMSFQKEIGSKLWEHVVHRCICGPRDLEMPILSPQLYWLLLHLCGQRKKVDPWWLLLMTFRWKALWRRFTQRQAVASNSAKHLTTYAGNQVMGCTDPWAGFWDQFVIHLVLNKEPQLLERMDSSLAAGLVRLPLLRHFPRSAHAGYITRFVDVDAPSMGVQLKSLPKWFRHAYLEQTL